MSRRDIFPGNGNKRLVFEPCPAGTVYQEGPGRLRFLVSNCEMGTPVRDYPLDIRQLEDAYNARRLLGTKTT